MSPIITDVIKYASPYAPIDPNKARQNGFSQPTKQPPCLYHSTVSYGNFKRITKCKGLCIKADNS